MTRYGFPEGSCVIPNKAAYMNDETWENLVKVVAPGIIRMKVSNVACVFTILFSIFNYPSLSLQILFRKFVIYLSGGHSSHIMDSSLT